MIPRLPTSVFRCRLLPVSHVRRSFASARDKRSGGGTSSSSSSNQDDLDTARLWLSTLHAEAIPLKSIGELTFSRSSGPGGQNVNKVNSKATLRVPLEALLAHVPTALHGHIKQSRYIAPRSTTLIIQADDSRKQSDNAHSCYQRLYRVIEQAGQHALPNQPSAEQVDHVKKLQTTDNERRLRSKKHQSAKKSARRSQGHD